VRLLDWAMLLVLVCEIPSLATSLYPANGLSLSKTVCAAVLSYFLVRITVRTARQALVNCLLVTTGGVVLAWFAFTQFTDQVHALDAAGLGPFGIVAFRARLIMPPLPWVVGEWFTLVLLTLPFAAAAAFFWSSQKKLPAAGSALAALSIAATILLSCSRAIFWGLLVFLVAAFGSAAIYRTMKVGRALIAIAGTVCALGVVLFAENAAYPGIAEAYTGRHTSQVRSAEGRLAIWKRSADVFVRSPLWGVGSGNAPLLLAASADEDQTTGFASRTFSLPVQVLTEKGIVGTTLYIAVLVLAGWQAHRKLRNPKVSPQMKGMTCCFVAGVAAVLFREFTYSSLLAHTATAMLFTTMLALLVSEESA
jgi:O-antigen ligase